ncbi:MAG: hypothetical protein J6Y95_05700 [Lachnospiraceae bacterium]|nr:hypothetical protein [Lachnospiraceae bacterium]
MDIKAPSQTNLTFIAVLTQGGNVFFYDYVKDEITLRLQNSFFKLSSMMFNYDGNRILCAADHKSALIFSCADGSLIETLEADFNFSTAEYAVRDYYENARSDIYIILFTGDYGYLNLDEMRRIMIYTTNVVSEADRYQTVLPARSFDSAAFSTDTKPVWLAQGGSNVINTPLSVCDTATGNQLAILDDISSRIYAFMNRMITLPVTSDLGFVEDDRSYFRVYDADTFEEVTTVYPSYPHVYGVEYQYDGMQAGIMFEKPRFTKNEKVMFLQWSHNNNIYYSEAFVFAYDTDTWEELWHIGIYDAYDRKNNSVMPETDDYDGNLYLYAFPAGDDKILLQYQYNTGTDAYRISSTYNNRMAYELRDAFTGEVLERFAPEGEFKCVFDEDLEQVFLYTDEDTFNAHAPAWVFNTDSFENLAGSYVYQEPKEEEDLIDLGGGIAAENGDLLLINARSEYYILRIPTLEEAMESARKILGERTLSEAQREAYFLAQ